MSDAHSSGPFVTADWLAIHRDEVVLADARWYLDGRSGWQAYLAGHLSGAVFVDLDRWLSGLGGPEAGRNPLPDPEVFAEGMASLGISDDATVIAYDDAGGVIAARLVWMLRITGHSAAVLDGGMNSWDGDLETAVPRVPRASFTPHPWPAERLADLTDLGDAAAPGAVTIDARNADRFEGQQDPVDPRPGHIPGAVNVPCRANLNGFGRLLPRDQLLENFLAAGITAAADVVSYCGSGVTACHNLLTLEHLGMGQGRLYVGGWSQYAHGPDRPVETGPARPRGEFHLPTAGISPRTTAKTWRDRTDVGPGQIE